jgi:hypothetical protein
MPSSLSGKGTRAGIVDRIEQARGFKRRRRVLVYCGEGTGLDTKPAGRNTVLVPLAP